MAPWKFGDRIKDKEFFRIISDNSLVVMSSRVNRKMNAKAWVVSIAMTVITVYGAWYGAHLRTQWQAHKKQKAMLQATPQEMIVELEAARSKLLQAKTEIEKRIAKSRERQRLEQAEAEKASK